jgi:hypothetical protein
MLRTELGGRRMPTDRAEGITALLTAAQEAHSIYEATELNGVYDEEWPRWYVAYAVEHGIGALLGREVTADELAAFLASSYAEYEQTDPQQRAPWPAHTARRIEAEL